MSTALYILAGMAALILAPIGVGIWFVFNASKWVFLPGETDWPYQDAPREDGFHARETIEDRARG